VIETTDWQPFARAGARRRVIMLLVAICPTKMGPVLSLLVGAARRRQKVPNDYVAVFLILYYTHEDEAYNHS